VIPMRRASRSLPPVGTTRRDWRDYPVWVATIGMLGSAVVSRWLGEAFWEDGYAPVLALLTMAALALLCRRMTMEVFGALIVVSWLVEGAGWLLDTEGWPVLAVGAAAMIATAYLLGDKPHRSTTRESRA
jgi:hypothetical protein